ncbi:HTH-type transcriptional regulator SinR [compost metagenome]
MEKIGEVLHVPVEEFVNSEQQDRPAGELDREWEDIVREAMKSGVSKEQFKEFLEFNKWKSNRE